MELLNLEAAIFDLDGVVFNSEPLYQRAWCAAARDCGYALTAEEHLQLRGRGRRGAIAKLCQMAGAGFKSDLLPERLEYYEKLFFSAASLPLKPGVLELLHELKVRNIKTAIATSTSRENTLFRMERNGLSGKFTIIVTGDDVQRGKPYPDIFLLAAGRLGASPARCLVFEDSEAGLEAARRAGMIACLVPDLDQPNERTKVLAEYVFASLVEARQRLFGG